MLNPKPGMQARWPNDEGAHAGAPSGQLVDHVSGQPDMEKCDHVGEDGHASPGEDTEAWHCSMCLESVINGHSCDLGPSEMTYCALSARLHGETWLVCWQAPANPSAAHAEEPQVLSTNNQTPVRAHAPRR